MVAAFALLGLPGAFVLEVAETAVTALGGAPLPSDAVWGSAIITSLFLGAAAGPVGVILAIAAPALPRGRYVLLVILVTLLITGAAAVLLVLAARPPDGA